MPSIQVTTAGGGRAVALPPAPGKLVIGSARNCHVVLAEAGVDPRHVTIEMTPGGVKITDQNSKSGTRLNGMFVSQALLKPGDSLVVGQAVITLIGESMGDDVARAPLPPSAPAQVRSPGPARSKTAKPTSSIPPRAPAKPKPKLPPRAPATPVSIEGRHPGAGRRGRKKKSSLFWALSGGAVVVLVLVLVLQMGESGEERAKIIAFEDAKRTHDAGKFDAAEAAFKEFVTRYPGTARAERAATILEDIRKHREREAEAHRVVAELDGRWEQFSYKEYEKEYRMFRSRYDGTVAFADEAWLPKVKERYAAEGRRRFTDTKRRAGRLVAQGRFFDAVLAWHDYISVPGNIPPDIDAATGQFKVVHGKANEAFKEVEAKVAGLLDAEKFEEANAYLKTRLTAFRGTRHAFAIRQKLELVAILATGEEEEPEAAVAKVAKREEYLRAAENAESLATRRRYRDAITAFETAADDCPHEDLSAEFRARAADLADYAALFTELRKQIAATPDRFRGVSLSHGFKANVVDADEESLTVEIRGARSALSWSRMTQERILELLKRLRFDAPGRLRLARFALETGDEETAHKAITAALKANEELEERAFLILARGRKIPVPDGGFVPYRGRWLTPLERDAAVLADQIADAAKDAKSSDRKRRDAGMAALKALGTPARTALIGALEHQREASVEELLSLSVIRDPATKNVLVNEIKARRVPALTLIFDKVKYPYPHPPGPAYDQVQAEVDSLVDAVRLIWERPIEFLLEKHPEAQELYSRAEGYSLELEEMGIVPEVPFADLIGRVNAALSIREFPGGGVGKSAIEWNAKCLAYNRDIDIGLDKEEAHCTDAVNEYRMMMGRRAVKWNDKLLSCARAHSTHMKENSYFAHDVPLRFAGCDDIRTPGKRARKAGYGGGVSENIARGSQTGVGSFKQWYGSSGHHRNMLTKGHTEIGVGRDSDFWTQNFGRASQKFDLPTKPGNSGGR